MHDLIHDDLGLRPDAVVLPVSPLLCGASSRLLALAADLVAAHPDRTVLVVVVEAVGSMGYQPLGDSTASVLTRLTFADSAAACVVRSEPGPGTCLLLDPGRIRHTTSPVQQRPLHTLDHRADGLHFGMSRAGALAVVALLDPLLDWALDGRPDWRPGAMIIHPGGPIILDALARRLARRLPLDDWAGLLDEARASYATGNRSGPAMSDIFARVAARRPAPGTPALLWSVAPGGRHVSAAALTGRWYAP